MHVINMISCRLSLEAVKIMLKQVADGALESKQTGITVRMQNGRSEDSSKCLNFQLVSGQVSFSDDQNC